MTADVAVLPRRDGKKETSPVKSPSSDHGVKKEGDEGQVVKTLAQILRSADPETTLLGAINDGTIPDEICLELAEHLGELVKALDFDNRIEIVFALHESEVISEKTEQYLLLAILKMDEQEEISACPVAPLEADGTGASAEIAPLIPEPTLESPPPTPKASEDTRIADLIRSAAELQRQFGTNLPEEKLSEIRQAVGELTGEEFASLRQILGSAILAQAEIPADRRWAGVVASLEIVEILLGQRQEKLTSAAFTVYEVLVREGFRLRDRNDYNRPLMTVASITLLRNRFQSWLDSHKSNLGEELVSAEKAITTLEGFVLATRGDLKTQEAIRCDQATRLRKRIVSSRIRALDLVGEELVAAQPTTKEEALNLLEGYLHAKQSELAFELRTTGSAILGEAETTIQQILNLQLATSALRHELAELEASNYDPLAQRPVLSDRDWWLAVYELERKELDSIRAELETALEEGSVADRSYNRNRKEFQILLTITASKLQELDQLIVGIRSASTEVRHG